ncbi:uncharacterized protein PG986_003789 [Apiospora aurea]|uniref:Uncharacterized protein n=1 Tax=Apiospora aurea TaxID=335848 RepID=A0ABR1QSM3_9PEZI
MDSTGGPTHAFENDKRLLFTTSLATCIEMAISGIYPPALPTSREKWNDRFMIHTSEDMAEENYAALLEEVKGAKARGLQDLEAHVAACDPATNALSSSEAQNSLKERLRELVGSDARIRWYPYQFDTTYDVSMPLSKSRNVIVQRQIEGDLETRERLEEKR